MVQSLVGHEGEGSMYRCLHDLAYISALEVDLNDCIVTAMRFVTFELVLTETGLENYQKVLAIAFEYFRVVKDEWLADGKEV